MAKNKYSRKPRPLSERDVIYDRLAKKSEPSIWMDDKNKKSAVFRKAHKKQLKEHGILSRKSPGRKASQRHSIAQMDNDAKYKRGEIDKDTYKHNVKKIEAKYRGFKVKAGKVMRKKRKKYEETASKVRKIKIPLSGRPSNAPSLYK